MNWLMRLLWLFIGQQVKQKMMNEARRRGVLAYLQVLQASRKVIILALLAFFVLQSMVIAGFGALVTGFIIWDHDFPAKMQILFGVFLGMWAIPTLVLLIILSEKVWYKASGAEKMVNDLNRDST